MRPNGNTRTHPCGRSRSPRSVPNVFAGTLPTSSSAPVPEMARCRVFSECSGPCCVPDRGRGWPRLLVYADSPTSDSLQPCGQPKQQFPGALESGPEVGAYCQHAFGQSDQISVPRQQSFRRGDGRHLLQRFPAQLFRCGRQSPSLVIVELQTPITHLLPKDAILLDQICDNLLLMSAHPSSDGKHHN